MKIKTFFGKLEKFKGDVLALGVFEEEIKKKIKPKEASTPFLSYLLSAQAAKRDFRAALGEQVIISSEEIKEKKLKIGAKKIIFIGLGSKEKFDLEAARKAAAFLSKKTKELDQNNLGVYFPNFLKEEFSPQTVAQVLSEGFLLENYQFLKYKTELKKVQKKNLKEVFFILPEKQFKKQISEGIELGKIFAQGVFYVRDLVNEPASQIFPETLKEEAIKLADFELNSLEEMAGKEGIGVLVFDEKQIKELGMGGLLGVAAGSDHPPYFVHLIYKPSQEKMKKVVFVGKSLTFDSGGLSLKPSEAMGNMKIDMAAGAVVLGLFKVLKKIKPKAEIHGILPICENMPSGKALKPGDILKTMSGKTIEVLNTDAEGRITLADGLFYATRLKPDYLIDLATLTGACIVALGEEVAGLMGNNRFLLDALKKASEKSGEKIWELPLVEEYAQFLKNSFVADLTNITSPKIGAGAITAGLFLQEFVGETFWAHLDIAGPAWEEKQIIPYVPKGGTGFGLRTLLYFLKENF